MEECHESCIKRSNCTEAESIISMLSNHLNILNSLLSNIMCSDTLTFALQLIHILPATYLVLCTYTCSQVRLLTFWATFILREKLCVNLFLSTCSNTCNWGARFTTPMWHLTSPGKAAEKWGYNSSLPQSLDPYIACRPESQMSCPHCPTVTTHLT